MGIKVGLLHITCFRPFPSIEIVEALAPRAKRISVIERLDIPMMQSNPSCAKSRPRSPMRMAGTPGYPEITQMPQVLRRLGRSGQPRCSRRRFHRHRREHASASSPRTYFTRGHQARDRACRSPIDPDVRAPGSFSMRGHSVGGYGSVTTNKVIATIAGEVFGMDVQAYPKYGSEKKGLPTTYYLTIAKEHIRVHSELEHVEFIPLNDVNAFNLENPLAGLTQNGMVFVQSQKTDPAEVWAAVPPGPRRNCVQKNARLFALDTVRSRAKFRRWPTCSSACRASCCWEYSCGSRRFRPNIAISDEVLFKGVEKSLRKYFGKRGEQVVQDNLKAVQRGYHEVFEIPREVMTVPAQRPKTN